jgi:hypothetical protein
MVVIPAKVTGVLCSGSGKDALARHFPPVRAAQCSRGRRASPKLNKNMLPGRDHQLKADLHEVAAALDSFR